MPGRRDFFKQTSLMVGASGLFLSESIRRAFAIDPSPGTSFMDAEHVVILMQENRSFDHLYGSLRGVRGFDDPRAIQLPMEIRSGVSPTETAKRSRPSGSI